jgi:hypothetical protein
MDIISKGFEKLPRFLGGLNICTRSFIIRAALVLFFGCLLPAIAFRQGVRSPMLQRFLFLVGVLIGGSIPISGLLNINQRVMGYLLLLGIIGLVFLSLLIPFLIGRTAGAEGKLKWWIMGTLAGLFLLNLISV